jgi:hypothetical protein
MISAASAGALQSTFRPMSSSVTTWTWFRVSASTLRTTPDLPLPRVRELRLLELLIDAMNTAEENGLESVSEMNESDGRTRQAEAG